MTLMVVPGCCLERDRSSVQQGLFLCFALTVDSRVAVVGEYVAQLGGFFPSLHQ